jgi:hypothetical protein
MGCGVEGHTKAMITVLMEGLTLVAHIVGAVKAGIRVLSARPFSQENIMKRFTAYRTEMDSVGTHNHYQANPQDEPQFEGVIWTDGTVTLRWLTGCRSHSIWATLSDCLNIHGHPEYGTKIIWHDGPTPKEWVNKLAEVPNE